MKRKNATEKNVKTLFMVSVSLELKNVKSAN